MGTLEKTAFFGKTKTKTKMLQPCSSSCTCERSTHTRSSTAPGSRIGT